MLKIKGQKPDPMIPPISLFALLKLSNTGHMDDVVVAERPLRFTRRDLMRDVKNLAKALLELEVKPGEIVTVATGRSMYANIVIAFAVNRLGATICFIDEKTPRETLINHLDEFRSRVVFTYRRGSQWGKDLGRAAKSVEYVIDMDLHHDASDVSGESKSVLDRFYLGPALVIKAVLSFSPEEWDRFFAGKSDEIMLRRAQWDDDQPRLDNYYPLPILHVAAMHKGKVPSHLFNTNQEALISFTSGSTSGPKPMVFTNKNLVAAAIYSKIASNVKMWDKNLHSWLNIVHWDCPYGVVVSTLAPICGGGMLIVTPDFDESNLEEYASRANTIFGIPSILEMLTENPNSRVDLSELKMFASGGERLEKELSLKAREFFAMHGAQRIQMSNGYGVGEALGLISTAVGDVAYNPDSVGKIPCGVHVMVLDPETGKELGFNQTGILCVTGKHILKRYFNRPELEAEKIITVDGQRFVKTGDLGFVSEDGFITLVGRATFFINNIPAKVYYEVVRAAVAQSELVKKCYVVKGPDKAWRLASYAFVVLNEGVEPNDVTRLTILDKAAEPFALGEQTLSLKDYELPQHIIFLDEFPATNAGKIDFRKLEQMAQEMAEPKKTRAEPEKTQSAPEEVQETPEKESETESQEVSKPEKAQAESAQK